MNSYTIPRKLKEEIKIFDKPFNLYIKDIATTGICIALFWMLSSFVHVYLVVPYWIFAVLCSVYLVLPAGKINYGKRKWQAIYFTLIADNNVYRSIDTIKIMEDKINVQYRTQEKPRTKQK